MFKEVLYQSLNMEMAILLETTLFSWAGFQEEKCWQFENRRFCFGSARK